jgi:putative transcriptional regulator
MRKMNCRLASLIDAYNLKISEKGSGARLTQRNLSLETGLAATTLNRLYRNDFDRIDVRTVETLCNFFGCNVGDLLVMREVEIQ